MSWSLSSLQLSSLPPLGSPTRQKRSISSGSGESVPLARNTFSLTKVPSECSSVQPKKNLGHWKQKKQ